MDFNTRCKISGYSYTAPTVTTPMPTLMEMKREAADDIFRTRRVKPHDCRDEKLVDFRDKHLWEAWLLSHGARQTADSVNALYRSPAEEELKNHVDKLVFTIGNRGAANGQFEYPRGLVVDDYGSILVADTQNHRVQIFNQCGVYKRKMGTFGSDEGQFNCPTGVAVLPNDDIAVADQKNKRIQVFTPELKFKFQFPTQGEPLALVADQEFHLVVATSSRSTEVYRRQGKLLSRFTLADPQTSTPSSKSRPGGGGGSGMLFIAVNNKDEVLVSDPASCSVTYYKYDGAPLYRFEPPAAAEGLAVVPSGLAVDPLGQVVVADSLNHVINVYSERGALLQHHAGPTDNVGNLQAIALGSDGHLVAIETAANGPHCVKIFRYTDCVCHRDRPGSSLRHTPVPTDVD